MNNKMNTFISCTHTHARGCAQLHCSRFTDIIALKCRLVSFTDITLKLLTW